MVFFKFFILEIYSALTIAEVGSKDNCDRPQFSIFQYFHFYCIEKWRAVAW